MCSGFPYAWCHGKKRFNSSGNPWIIHCFVCISNNFNLYCGLSIIFHALIVASLHILPVPALMYFPPHPAPVNSKKQGHLFLGLLKLDSVGPNIRDFLNLIMWPHMIRLGFSFLLLFYPHVSFIFAFFIFIILF